MLQSCGVAAPRVIARDLGGVETGTGALVLTYLEGSADVPTHPTTSRLRALGRLAAEIHAVQVGRDPDLVLRPHHMPWVDLSGERRAGGMPSTALLDAADAVAAPRVTGTDLASLVHGDLWSGNTVWRHDALVGTIDWEAAGVGHAGVDLGALRFDAALLYGGDAAHAGWEEAAGSTAADVALWDVIAARNTTPDMAGFLPGFHRAGRTDLDAATLVLRRDGFLEGALAALC